MRVKRLHVDNTLVFCLNDFGQMRMDQRRLSCVHVHVEEGSVKRRYQ